MTTQSEAAARRQQEREGRTAFGGDSRSVASPEALAAWERSLANYVPPGGPGPRQRLDDQSREAAYDPAADMYDPRNMRPVDFQGQTLWTNNYDNLPVTRPQPVTKLSTSPAITKKVSSLVAQPSSDYDVPPDLNRGLQPQFSSDYDVPPDQRPAQPYVATRYSDEDYLPPAQPPQVPPVASLPPYLLPSGVGMPYPPGTFDPRPPKPVVAAGMPPQPSSRPNWSNPKMDRANQWLKNKLGALNNWNGQIYAEGGPVGYAGGGPFEGDFNAEDLLGPIGQNVLGGIRGEGGSTLGDIAMMVSPLAGLLGGGGGGTGGLGGLLGLFNEGGPVGYAGGGALGMPADDPDDAFTPMTAFGGNTQIGPSHAVVGQNAPLPSMGGGGGGGGKSESGGMGDIMGMVTKLAPLAISAFSDERLKDNIKPVGKTKSGMKVIQYNMKGSPQTQIGLSAQDVEKKRPGAVGNVGGFKTVDYGKALKANGGPIGMMRGGYPELYTRAQRTAFSTGGGDHHVRPDGRGNGRSDHIDASLSPGEFVMDAETVSLAGDGDNDAGARQFEGLRQKIRKHKGKQLAKGKFSPKAKPVESYMSSKLSASDRAAHAGVSDGMRQIGEAIMAKRKTAFGPPRRKRGQRGMFLGGLFGAGSASGPSQATSTSSNTSTTIDPGGQYTPLMEGVLGVGQNLLNKQYQPYDTEQRFAGFNQDQLNAQQGVRNAQGAWQPAFNTGQGNLNAASADAGGVGTAGQTAFNTAAGGPGGLGAANPYLNKAAGSWTDPGTSQAWMNPYQKNVTDAAVEQAQSAWSGPGGALQGLSDMFTGGGTAQFGRERMGDVAGKMSADFGRGLTQTLGALNQQGYNQGMTAFGNEQQRLAGMGSTAGQLGIGDIGAQTSLGTAQTNAATAGVNANLAAGQGQTAFGQAQQGALYKDANALNASGAQQQQLEQQKRDFAYNQNREQNNWDFTRAQQAQSLAGGWQLPTSSQSQSFGNQTTQQPTGSVAGNVLGAASAIGGMSTGKDTTVAGDVGSWIGKQFAAEGGPIRAAHGGHLAFGPGGQVPVTRAVRQRAMNRQPAIMARLQAAGGPGITPGQTPGMMPPKPAFASGGHLPRSYQRYHPMWQTDRADFAFGGRVGYAEGGDTGTDLGNWYDKRAAQRQYNQRQRAFENSLRNAEINAEAQADPAAYWQDLATQVPRGVASIAELAGIPGTFGVPGMPTMDSIGGQLDTAFGEPRTAGGRAGRESGSQLLNLLGLGSGNVAKAVRLADKLRRGVDFGGNAVSLGTAFGGG